MHEGEYRTNCYAVHLQSRNPQVKSSAFFHTGVPVSRKVSPRWDGNGHFIFETDGGTIHFRYKKRSLDRRTGISDLQRTPENSIRRETGLKVDQNIFEIGSVHLKKTGTVIYCPTKKLLWRIY